LVLQAAKAMGVHMQVDGAVAFDEGLASLMDLHVSRPGGSLIHVEHVGGWGTRRHTEPSLLRRCQGLRLNVPLAALRSQRLG
jgi:hypothetical protein